MVFLCDKSYEGDLVLPENIPPYPYPLSDFQKYAIEGVIKGHHVLVTAHTGSGKTLPAEFAIQHLTNQGKRVIYTSPIKALSNQKFYEFTRKYPHISFGLLTGDIKTNPTAQVLIMTTEILMNTLFQMDVNTSPNPPGELSFQMDINQELGCVIFDEVHYINDADRGQTWEQTILMLPHHIQMVMLSATIDNPIGFAEWIENRGQSVTKNVYLASTEHRVVPLTHYGYFATTNTPFKTIKDKEVQQQIRDATNKFILLRTPKGEFKDEGYHEIRKISNLFDKNDWRMKRKFVLNKLAEELTHQEMLPAIVFVFSRKSVEEAAKDITTNVLEFDSKVPYIIKNECEQIIRRFPNYREYLELPEYNDLVALLEKGVGIHHSGMIPVLREIVELMISKKYIKILFATESFAIGLDCPIKTAVFSALRKFDGAQTRFLLPHEYTQMAGRAGRRGIDTVGHVIHCNNLFDLPTLPEYKHILCSMPQKLVSKFKLSYQLVLNLIKTNRTFSGFIEESMFHREIEDKKSKLASETHQHISLYDNQKTILSQTQIPEDIFKEVSQIETNYSMYSNKKQKEYSKRIQAIETEYLQFRTNFATWKQLEVIKENIAKNEENMKYMAQYTNIHISFLCDILVETRYITLLEEKYELTKRGEIAATIHEIHPLLAADLCEYTSFRTYTPVQIACMLSIFTDIRLPDDIRTIRPKGVEELVIKDILVLENRREQYEWREAELGIRLNSVEFMYDLLRPIQLWSSAETDLDCKWILQGELAEIGVSVGDFTKAILKIAVIVKEFQTIAEEDLTFLTNLKGVEGMLLKYVATNQSLYV